MHIVISALLVLGGLGIIFALFLAFFSKLFKVKVNPRTVKVREELPGLNCGACGYAGCDDYAKAIAEKKEKPNLCSPGGQDVAEKVAKIIGAHIEQVEQRVSLVNCNGGMNCKDDFIYDGEKSCNAAVLVSGGQKSCSYGCIGFGDCVNVCPVDAIVIVKGIPVVDEEKCIACGLCVKECPKNLFELVKKKQDVYVKCSSKDSGKNTVLICDVGCIACKKCENVCPVKPEPAVTVVGNISKINYKLCINCGACARVCPRGIIIDKRAKK